MEPFYPETELVGEMWPNNVEEAEEYEWKQSMNSNHLVEQAVDLLREAAEIHEQANPRDDGEDPFCEHTRVSMIVYAMMHLGLDLLSLGPIAEMLAEALAMNEAMLSEEDDDDGVLQSSEIGLP